jgi:hypothetical protein
MSGSYYNLQQKYLTILALESQSNSDPNLQDVITVSPNLDGIAPTSGQAITYDGTDVVWGDVTTSTPNLQQVTDISGETTNDMVITNGLKRLDLQKDGVSMAEYSTTKVASYGLNGFSISNPNTSISANLTAGLNITDTIFSNTLTKSNILLETDASVTNPNPEVYIETLVNDSLSADFALAFINSYVDIDNNYIANLSLQTQSNTLLATSSSIDINGQSNLSKTKLQFNGLVTQSIYGLDDISMVGTSGTVHIDPSYGLVFTKSAVVSKLTNDQLFFTNGTDVSTYKRLEFVLDDGTYRNTTNNNDIYLQDLVGGLSMALTRDKLEFNAQNKGLYSIADDLTLACPELLDISANGLAFNGVQGDIGEILISNGSGLSPVWSGIKNIICNGSVATPGVNGTVLFTSFSASFSYAPVVILTVVSGNTNTYIANIISVTNLQFTYTISGDGCSALNFIAL